MPVLYINNFKRTMYITPKEVINEAKLRVLENIRFEQYPPRVTGGQSCGIIVPGCRLISEDEGFEICITTYRSQIRNRELALQLFELYLDEVIK